jgi:hypothetical protein
MKAGALVVILGLHRALCGVLPMKLNATSIFQSIDDFNILHPLKVARYLPDSCHFFEDLQYNRYYYTVQCEKAFIRGYSKRSVLCVESLTASDASNVRGKELLKFHEALAMERGYKESSLVDASTFSGIRTSLVFTLLSETKPDQTESYYTRLGYKCQYYNQQVQYSPQQCWELTIEELMDDAGKEYRHDVAEIASSYADCRTVSCLFRKGTMEEKEMLGAAIKFADAYSRRTIACQELFSSMTCRKSLS